MPRSTPLLSSFAAGESSPKTDGRLDLEGYHQSCAKLLNMLPIVQGPVEKRTGTKYIAEVKASANFTRLIPFKYSSGDNYVLEFGDEYVRFYTQGGVLMDGGSPYEIVSPYDTLDLDLLKFVQQADAMYIVHPLYPVYKLLRSGATSWTLTAVDFAWGPFLEENDTNTTITPSATTGNGITLTASTAIFHADHIGAFWKLVDDYTISGTISAVNDTVGNMDLNAGESMVISLSGTWAATIELQRSYDNGSTWLTYLSFTANATLEINNLEDDVLYRWRCTAHTSGSATARLTQRNAAGYVKITNVATGGLKTTATANVIETLPSTDATKKWSEGAFSDYRGYPAAVAFYEQRLILAGTAYRPATLWGSEVDDYESFETGTADDKAYSFTLVAAEVNPIRWLQDQKVLFIGDGGSEWKFGFYDEATTATNVDAKRESTHGSKSIQSLLVQNSCIFIEDGGRAVRAIVYNFDEDSYLAPRFSDHAEHLLTLPVNDMAFQAKPNPVIWLVRSDGYLLSCTFRRGEKMAAFAQHYLGGEVESVAVIGGSDRDEVWAVVKRTISGATKRYVEQFQTHAWTEVEDAIFIDSGLSYNGYNTNLSNTLALSGGPPWVEGSSLTLTAAGGHTPFSAGSVGDYYLLKSGDDYARVKVTAYTSTTVVTVKAQNDVPGSLQGTATGTWALMAEALSGMGHLEGKTVKILTDGAVHPPKTIASGAFTLNWPAAKVNAGLGYNGLLKTKKLDYVYQSGTTIGKEQTIFEVAVRLYHSINCKVGYDEDNLDTIYFRTTKTPIGSAPALFTGDKKIPFKNRGGSSFEGHIVIANDDPLPFTVLAIAPTKYDTQL